MYCIGKIVPCTVQVDCLILQAHSVQEKHQSVLELFLHYRYHTTALLALLCTKVRVTKVVADHDL